MAIVQRLRRFNRRVRPIKSVESADSYFIKGVC